ncbi:MAG: SLATT domain-containing protein [Gallionella sp.]|nr:SLATT domain-containing protein [Gallionella sp.]
MDNQPSSRDIPPQNHDGFEDEYDSTYDALNALAKNLATRATLIVNWYLNHKRWPRRFSRLLRAASITLAVLGGLAPLQGQEKGVDHLGYILIALAGASLLVDRYFGYSTSWMRYMSTQMALQRALDNFQLAWTLWRIQIRNKTPSTGVVSLTSEQQAAGILLLTTFQQQISDLVDKEFQTWIIQFQEQLTALQAAVDKDKKEARPGNLVVSFHAQTAITGQSEVYLNNQMVRKTDTNGVILTGLLPGSHLISIKANNGTLLGNGTAVVEAGQTSEKNIELKSNGLS